MQLGILTLNPEVVREIKVARYDIEMCSHCQDNNLSLIALSSSSASLRRTGIGFLVVGIVFLGVAIGVTIVRLLASQPCIPSVNCSLAGRFKLRYKAPR
jgi:hypothetical protein